MKTILEVAMSILEGKDKKEDAKAVLDKVRKDIGPGEDKNHDGKKDKNADDDSKGDDKSDDDGDTKDAPPKGDDKDDSKSDESSDDDQSDDEGGDDKPAPKKDSPVKDDGKDDGADEGSDKAQEDDSDDNADDQDDSEKPAFGKKDGGEDKGDGSPLGDKDKEGGDDEEEEPEVDGSSSSKINVTPTIDDPDDTDGEAINSESVKLQAEFDALKSIQESYVAITKVRGPMLGEELASRSRQIKMEKLSGKILKAKITETLNEGMDVEHETHGKGQSIPGQWKRHGQTYKADVMFDHGIETVPVTFSFDTE